MWSLFGGSAVIFGVTALPILYFLRNDFLPALGLALGVPTFLGPISLAVAYWFQEYGAGGCDLLLFIIGSPFLILFGFSYILAVVGGGFLGVAVASTGFWLVRRRLPRPLQEQS